MIRTRRSHLADCDHHMSPLNKWGVEDGKVIRLREKVAIYAFGLGKGEAPLEDPEWAVWALNVIAPRDGLGRIRADLWWEIHSRVAQSEDDMRWIAMCPVPIVVPPDLMDASENAVALPMERINREFPDAPFSCTFAYQLAMALLLDFKTIGLFGVELAYGSPRERTVEWACVNWWIGMAQGRGVEVVRPEHTRLGRHPEFYGLDYDAEIKSTNEYLRYMRMGEPGEEPEGIGG